jgi:hypothetical protein
MTPHPLKTVEEILSDAKNLAEAVIAIGPLVGIDERAQSLVKNVDALRAIMGQDVDVEMLIHEIIGATQIPPGTTSRDYLRQAIGHLQSTGRICGVPDGFVMIPRELTDAMIDAGRKAWKEYVRENPKWQSGLNATNWTRLKYRIRYKAMIEAAASTPGGADE